MSFASDIARLFVKAGVLVPVYLFIPLFTATVWNLALSLFQYDWLNRWSRMDSLMTNDSMSAEAVRQFYTNITWNQSVYEISSLPASMHSPAHALDVMPALAMIGFALGLFTFGLMFVRAYRKSGRLSRETLLDQMPWFLDTVDGLLETSLRTLIVLLLIIIVWGFLSLALLFSPEYIEVIVLILVPLCGLPPIIGVARRELAPTLKRTLTNLQDW